MVDVNLIPKEYKKRKETLKVIFSKTGGVVLILLILSLLFYSGLLFYQNRLNKNMESIREETALLDEKRDPETEKTIIDLDKNLDIMTQLFEDHLYWSELFTKIEELTLPEVYFSDAKLSFSGNKINVNFSGNALTYTILARQILSFQEEPFVEEVRVSDISLASEGGLKFNLEIIFNKDILLKEISEL